MRYPPTWYRPTRFDLLVIAAVIAAGFAGIFLMTWLLGGSDIVITNHPPDEPAQPYGILSGVPCAAYNRRPVAVMLASDAEARPLSGIGKADIVFEMPVTPDGITRMMAVFQCQAPAEIGSIRSARKDFIPLAQGIDALLVHWGGERDILERLDTGIMDNVDALKYEGSTFYRKSSVPRPHNGFTTITLVDERADILGYRATTSLEPYPRTAVEAPRSLGSLSDVIDVPWPPGMDVRFTYDRTTNTYLRSRGGEPEIDALDGTRVSASVVILIQSESEQLRDQYLNIDTIGSGVATIWQGGQRINALWKKERADAMLLLTDSRGQTIPLQRGTVWILIDAPLP